MQGEGGGGERGEKGEGKGGRAVLMGAEGPREGRVREEEMEGFQEDEGGAGAMWAEKEVV